MFNGQENNVWLNPNITSSVPWPILTAGGDGVPPLLVLICLIMWAFGCVVLGLVYGERKRWSATFDGYAFQKFCEGGGGELRRELIFDK